MFKECQLSSFLCYSHKERAKNKMIEKCIRCNKPTPYSINTPISSRQFYIDGSGQLCEECFATLFPSFSSSSYSSTSNSSTTYSPTAGEKEEKNKNLQSIPLEIKKDGLERLKAARKEKPLHRSDFTEAELEKLKVLAPEEYELLK